MSHSPLEIRQTDRQTDRHTHRMTTVTLTHAPRISNDNVYMDNPMFNGFSLKVLKLLPYIYCKGCTHIIVPVVLQFS